MIRRLNRTGRRQIARADVAVRLRSTEGNEPPIFDLALHLDDYGFPPDARVRVEAWRSNAVQRWDFNTVADVLAGNQPSDDERRMRDVPQSSQFRVLVVAGDGSGRLLGHLPSIRPVLPQESLLPIKEVGEDRLGEEVWRVDFGDGGNSPVLLLNSTVTDINKIVRTDVPFRSLVMPAVLRGILTQALIDQHAEPEDDEDSSWNGWFLLAESLCPEAEIPSLGIQTQESDLNAVKEWIEIVVRAFAKERVLAASAYDSAWRTGA